MNNPHKSREKDTWDKAQILAPVIVTLLLGGLGTWFKNSYDASQLRMRELELVERFLPHLEEDGSPRKAAILALRSLGSDHLAREFAAIYGGEAAANALTELGAQSQGDPQNQAAYFDVYRRVVQEQPKLALVGPPDYIEPRMVAFTTMRAEQRTREVAYTSMVPQQRTRTVSVAKVRQEERTRMVTKTDPVTQEPVLDDAGNPVKVEETYTVDVPYIEQVEQAYTAMVPEQRTRSVPYTVMVPEQRERPEKFEVYETNVARLSAAIKELLDTEDITSVDELERRLKLQLAVQPDQINALRRQLTWQTVRDPATGRLKYRVLPGQFELPQTVVTAAPQPDSIIEGPVSSQIEPDGNEEPVEAPIGDTPAADPS